MVTIRTELQICDDLAVAAKRCDTFIGDSIPNVDAFVRARSGQVSSRRVNVDFDQIARIVVHRTFARSNSFAILRVVNSGREERGMKTASSMPILSYLIIRSWQAVLTSSRV